MGIHTSSRIREDERVIPSSRTLRIDKSPRTIEETDKFSNSNNGEGVTNCKKIPLTPAQSYCSHATIYADAVPSLPDPALLSRLVPSDLTERLSRPISSKGSCLTTSPSKVGRRSCEIEAARERTELGFLCCAELTRVCIDWFRSVMSTFVSSCPDFSYSLLSLLLIERWEAGDRGDLEFPPPGERIVAKVSIESRLLR